MKKAENIDVIRKRPRLLDWLIGEAYPVTMTQFGMMMLPEFRHAGLFVPAIYGIIVTFTFIALVGIWHMKRWGLEMLIYAFLVRLIFLATIDEISVVGIVYQLTIIIICVPYYKRMDRNL
ncbi:MAG: hypothetical protein FD123_3134 [Bacteroidetes bacterium]|nr:MAG: hypothetical protein FD123_3134 [Bacteroidota bacterium]